MESQNKLFDQFKEAAVLDEGNEFPFAEDVWRKIESRLEEKEQKKKIIPWLKYAAVAALLFLILATGFYLISNNNSNDKPQPTYTNKGEQPLKTKGINNISSHQMQDTVAAKENIGEAKTKQHEEKKKQIAANTMRKNGNNIYKIKQANIEPKQDTVQKTDEVVIRGRKIDNRPFSGSVSTVTTEDIAKVPVAPITRAIDGSSLAVQQNSTAANANVYNWGRRQNNNPSNNYIHKNKTENSAAQQKPSQNYAINETRTQGVEIYKSENNQIAKTVTAADIEKRSITNVLKALDGQPGIQVTSEGGQPGASPKFIMRGMGSLSSSNYPLIVVDGVVYNKPLNSINPNDVQSMNALNSTKATSLFGSRGVNGVIIITTKTGNLNAKRNHIFRRIIRSKKYRRNAAINNNTSLQNEDIAAIAKKITDEEDYYFEPQSVDVSNESYEALEENRFENPAVNPLSTFSIDVDNAAYTNIRRFITNRQPVPKDAVRIEEMINYFKYKYPQPTGDTPFSINAEYSVTPWNLQHKLLKIGLQGKIIPTENIPPSNFVFLIDVSGSMDTYNKLPLVKESLKMLANQLREIDKVSIVVYAGAAGLVLPPTNGNNKADIMNAIERLSAGGSTAGGAGIELAYKIAKENFIPGGNNRVILATDGDFNVGASSDGDMQHLIEEKRKDKIFLTCLGYGMGNYKDSKMETLADKGNGNYAYIDNAAEANRVLVREFGGTMFAIAKDVKIQIEFNPTFVQSYRLIGYENRKLNAEDFADDAVDAGELGSGHSVTALYEIIPVGVNDKYSPENINLKYTNPATKSVDAVLGDELAQIKFRYKKPEEDSSRLIVQNIFNAEEKMENSSKDFKLAAAIAWFGLKLRDSKLVEDKSTTSILKLAKQGVDINNKEEAELLKMIEAVK